MNNYKIYNMSFLNSNDSILTIRKNVGKINILMKDIIGIIANRTSQDSLNYSEALRISKLVPSCVEHYEQVVNLLSAMPDYEQFMIKMDNNVDRWDGKSISLMDWITSFEMYLSQLIEEIDKII